MEDSQARLQGKTALITGAAKRLGKAMAMALAQQGANVVVHYHHSDQPAADTCAELRRLNVSAWRVQGDLSDSDQAQRVFAEAKSQAGAIDILINSASRFERDTLWDANNESLCRNLRLHAAAPLVLAREMARQERSGHIVNLLDTRVAVYDREHASYHISKRVLLTLTQMLALELAPQIAVNAIAPGLILPPEGEDESYLQRLAHANPLHRCGAAADIADAVLFLVSSRFITGQIMYVDGGYHMKGHLYD